jgi:hypothetical protein
MSSRNPIATAHVDNSVMWRWHLKIDSLGLFRWYLDGQIPTEIRGSTCDNAFDALSLVSVKGRFEAS